MEKRRRRLGIFGWGIVAPKSPDVETFEANLEDCGSWLEPFQGFGPSHFLVGEPAFEFERYRPWIDERFEPRKFAQLDSKMGDPVKFAIGAFIQALGQNEGLEETLRELGPLAHVYVGTGLGDLPTQYEIGLHYRDSQLRWDRFWCREEHHPELSAYAEASPEEKERIRRELGAPADPAAHDPMTDGHDEIVRAWLDFWVRRSRGLAAYLEELQEIEGESLGEDIEGSKGHLIRRKLAARKRLNRRYGCPTEPWNAASANLLWNIANIPAAQISMLGRITGTSMAPVAACSGFGTALKLADNAIQLGQARAVVVGMTDPPPHPLVVGAFQQARVLAHDGRVSKPLTGMRGTHVAGGACVWIVGDAEYLMERGFTPVGLEIVGVGLSSDADHIITPSVEGPRQAVHASLEEAGAGPEEVETWDMHATATPGDWTELQNALSIFPRGRTRFTARKGAFGHGMSVCGGWELTAQHLGVARGRLFPVGVEVDELHQQVRPYASSLIAVEGGVVDGGLAGKINMGIGGVNTAVICRPWGSDPKLEPEARDRVDPPQ